MTAPSAFGTYRVLHQIGSGVLGPVFRTFDPQRDRLVAIKAFRLDLLPEDVARLADALRKLAGDQALKHPAIVPVLDAGLEGTAAYLAMEYVAAETLDVAIRHLAPAPVERVLPIVAQLADAIDAAWAGGIGHGALHPRDVFVTADFSDIRLTGTGVVPALEAVGAKAPVRRPYAAPERINGEAWDVRSDVYALGAMTHELLTRRRPAPGSGEQDGAFATTASPEQRVQIRRVLSAVLAERPQHRFQSARAFADALAAIAHGEAMTLPEQTEFEVEDAPIVVVEVSAQPELDGFGAVAAPVEVPPAVAEVPAVVEEPAVSEEPAAAAAPIPEDSPWQPLAHDRQPASPVDLPLEPAVPALESIEPALAATTLTDRSSFPWTAVAAVAAAGLVVGIAIGYQYARHTESPAASTTAAAPAETEVRVPVEPGGQAEKPASPPPAGLPPRNLAASPSAPPAPAKTAGRLTVRSTPSGALVLVDGRPHGQTPASISDLAFGDHDVSVARPGFVPHTERVALDARSPTRAMSVRLQRGLSGASPVASTSGSGAGGSMFIDSRPQAARVIMDGRFMGTTPLQLTGVRMGSHAVRLERTGYKAFATTVGVKGGEQSRVTAALEEHQD